MILLRPSATSYTMIQHPLWRRNVGRFTLGSYLVAIGTSYWPGSGFAAPDTLPLSVVATVAPASTVSTITDGANLYVVNPIGDEPITAPIWPTYQWSDRRHARS
jgi:hypothetical protein